MEDRAERQAWFLTEILPFEPDVRRCIVRLGAPSGEIDDIAAEALARAYGHDDWRGVSRGKSFLFQIARNLVVDGARRRAVVAFECVADMEELGLVDEAPSPETMLCRKQEAEILLQVIGDLPKDRRRLFRQRWVDELPVDEIAVRLGVSPSAVEKRLASLTAWLKGEVAARERSSRRPINQEACAPRQARTGCETDPWGTPNPWRWDSARPLQSIAVDRPPMPRTIHANQNAGSSPFAQYTDCISSGPSSSRQVGLRTFHDIPADA